MIEMFVAMPSLLEALFNLAARVQAQLLRRGDACVTCACSTHEGAGCYSRTLPRLPTENGCQKVKRKHSHTEGPPTGINNSAVTIPERDE